MSGASLIELLAARLAGRGARRAAPALREALADVSSRGIASEPNPMMLRVSDLPERGVDAAKVREYGNMLSMSEPPPILVARRPGGSWEIMDGEHRAAAMRQAGRQEVPAIDISERVGWGAAQEAPQTAPSLRGALAEVNANRAPPDAGPVQSEHQAYLDDLRAQGFDTEERLYHGTTNAFGEFDSARAGARNNSHGAISDYGVFVTPRAEVASHIYATGEGGNVRPLFARGPFAEGAAVEARVEELVGGGATRDVAWRQARQEAQQAGFKGVRTGSFEVMVFDPSDLAPALGRARTAPDGGSARVEPTPDPRWFGNSRVVDDSGAPLLLHHGTTARDQILASGFKKGWAQFTDSRPVADSYQAWDRGGSPGTISGFVRAENPAYFDAGGLQYTDHAANLSYRISRAASEAEKAGHDALVVRNIRDHYDSSVPTEPHTTVIVFEPNTNFRNAEENLSRNAPNAGSDRNALQRALRERMERE